MISTEFDLAWTSSWPAAEYARAGGLIVGRGAGGGGRVSAARRLPGAEGAAADIGADIDRVEDRHRLWGQPPLFAVERDDAELAHALARRGYHEREPTLILSSPVAPLCAPDIPSVTALECWPPLAIQRELWAASGIGPERQGVMERVRVPKTAILGRTSDRAAGVGFVAVAGGLGMLHAIAVLPEWRGRGLGGWMVRRAARFAQARGADALALAVTKANADAQGFYARLGFSDIGGYAYWQRD